VPITLLLTLAQWNLLSPFDYYWGTESIAESLMQQEDQNVIVGNVQLYYSSWCWFAFSLFFLRLTRSSIFVLFSIISFLAWLTSCYIIAGMIGPIEEFNPWKPEIIAGRYLFPGIGFLVLGVILDRHKFIHFAWPLRGQASELHIQRSDISWTRRTLQVIGNPPSAHFGIYSQLAWPHPHPWHLENTRFG